MSPAASDFEIIAHRFPRVSGDEPGVLEAESELLQFSPREWG